MKKIYYIVILLILISFALFCPISHAVYESDLIIGSYDYYIIEWCQVTGSSWRIIGDQNGYYDKHIYIDDEVEKPMILEKMHLLLGHNKYVCRGKLLEEVAKDNDIHNFSFETCNILYPIKRNLLFGYLPDNYVCLVDLFLD